MHNEELKRVNEAIKNFRHLENLIVWARTETIKEEDLKAIEAID